jgi:hypothetical protein
MSLVQDIATARWLSILGPDAKGDPPESTCCGCLAALEGEAPCGSASFFRIRPATAIAWERSAGSLTPKAGITASVSSASRAIAPMGRRPPVARALRPSRLRARIAT